MPWPTTEPDSPQRRLEEAIVFFLEAREAGHDVDLTDLLWRYRDVEAGLHKFLADQGALREAVTPLLRPDAEPTTGPLPATLGPYRVVSLLGEGGMGTVYRVHDARLNRDLALKVLHADLAAHAHLADRFLSEAQISAQLQHPGLPPVHEVGTLIDGRPYFAMRFIKGETLAADLSRRPAPTHELPRLVAVFGQICQAIAYSHSKDVLHRDLKPHNVMLGPFGEVLVMDWGLGKVLGEADDHAAPPAGSVVETVRKAAPHQRTAGAVGTFAYMPPEQALAQAERIGKRSDVFGLGAILCEILTGSPPYVAATYPLVKAACEAADLGPARERLASSGADAALIDLATRCLQANPDDRPADAAAVAAAVAGHLDGVREALRQADLSRAAAEARVASERRKREAQFAVFAGGSLAVLVTVLVCGVVAFNLHQRRQAGVREINALLARADVLHREAEGLDPERALALHNQAAEVVAQAEAVARERGDGDSRDRVRQRQRTIEEAIKAASRERNFTTALDKAARSGGLRVIDQRPDVVGMANLYREAFAKFDVNPGTPGAAAALATFSRKARMRAVEALDHWALCERKRAADLHALADDVDRDRFRQSVRKVWRGGFLMAQMKQLAEKPDDAPASALLLSQALTYWGATDDAVRVLRAAQAKSPGHFWINLTLGDALVASGDGAAEAVEYYRAAIAASPDASLAWQNLGVAYYLGLRFDKAEEALAQAVRVQRDNASAWIARASIALATRQDYETAEALLRDALASSPENASVKAMLAHALIMQGGLKRTEGGDWLREAEKDGQHDAEVLAQAGACHLTLNQAPAAVNRFRRAVEAIKDASHPRSQQLEAMALLFDGDSPAAEALARRALERTRQGFFRGQFLMLLGISLSYQGRPAEAEKYVNELIAVSPSVYNHYLLAQTQLWQGKTAEARKTLAQLRGLPGGAPAWLRDLIFDKLLPSDDEIRRVEKGEAELGDFSRTQQAEVALAMRKPYLAYGLMPARPDGKDFLASWASRWPSTLWNEPNAMVFSHRFNAARAAAMAGAGLGDDARPAPTDERPGLRQKALAWMREELDELREVVKKREGLRYGEVRRRLHFCLHSPEFAGVREADALAKLDGQEGRDWKDFWKEVNDLLEKLRE